MQEIKIKTIKKLFIKNDRYDLTMYKNNNFFANNILIHNTSARTSYCKVEIDPFKQLVNKIKFFIMTKLSAIPVIKRYVNYNDIIIKYPNLLLKIFAFIKYTKWQYVTGTRRVILDDFEDEKKLGFYGTNEFRKQWHDKFVNNLKKGETVYYEIVGYVNETTTIMPVCDNKKLNDKEFVKKYGDTTTFKYGCLSGQSDIYVYRITMTNEDGMSIEYSWDMMLERCKELGLKTVILICEKFIYDKQDLMGLAEKYCIGESTIDPSHIREGVVFRFDKGNKFEAYKHKSFEFKVLEGIIKDLGVADMEEAQEII